MKLNGILRLKKDAILKRWFQEVVDTYPEDAASFFRMEKNRFANPVGHATFTGLQGLYGALLAGHGPEQFAVFLDEIVRIRAVQEFTPSAAVSFVFSLKAILRREAGDVKGEAMAGELAEMDARIDGLALLAFDNYMACREKLFEIKVRELRERAAIQAGLRLERKVERGGARGKDKQGGANMKRGDSP